MFGSLPTLGVGCDVIATSTFLRALLTLRVRDLATFFSVAHSDTRGTQLRMRRGYHCEQH